MGIFKYGANLGRSFTYALPQVAKNIVPNLGDLFEQVKTEGRTGEIKDIFSEARTILKEDVGAVLRKGLDTALKDVTSGKLYKSDEETQAAASAAFGGQLGDTSLDDNDFLNADYYGSEGGDASGVSAAAAVGAASGVRAAAAAMGSSPEMQAAGVGAMATARLTRVGIGTSMAIGAGIERAIGASTRVLMDVHGFQNNVQHSYYKQSLENQTAMAGLLSDITAKMSTLIETTLVTATVTDRMLSAGSNRGIPLTRVFNPRGGINLAAYFSLLGNRLRSKVGEGSEFASFANGLTVTSPIGKAVEFMIESIVPKAVRKSLTAFDEFFGKLGPILGERAGHFGQKLKGKGGAWGIMGSLLNFLGVSPEVGSRSVNLGGAASSEKVAFDGFAHRSIVEVIPSYLADIHAELVAIRVGSKFAPPTDRKVYSTDTGRFTSEKHLRKQFDSKLDDATVSSFYSVQRDVGTGAQLGAAEMARIKAMPPSQQQTAMQKATYELRKRQEKERLGYKALGESGLSLPSTGKREDFEGLLKGHAEMLAREGRIGESEGLDYLSGVLGNAYEKKGKRGSRFLYNVQAAMLKSQAARAQIMEGAVRPGSEFADRMIHSGRPTNYRGDEVDGTLETMAGRLGGKSGIERDLLERRMELDRAASDPARISRLRQEIASLERGLGGAEQTASEWELTSEQAGTDYGQKNKESILRDSRGKVTLRSIVGAPMRLLAKVTEGFQDRVSDLLFGSTDDEKKRGLFGAIRDALMGDVGSNGRRTGPIGRLIDMIKYDVVEPIKKKMFGDPSDPDSVASSLWGKTSRWVSDLSSRASALLFGSATAADDGSIIRSGGLFASSINFLNGQWERMGRYLWGEDGKGGVLGDLRDQTKAFLSKANKAVFGELGADGRRVGGLLGNAIQSLKDMGTAAGQFMKERVLIPLAESILGKVGPDGKRAGGMLGGAIQKGKDFATRLMDDARQKVLIPLAESILGKVGPDGKRVGGMLGNAIQKGKDFATRLMDDVSKKVLKPLHRMLFGTGRAQFDDEGNITIVGRGIFPSIMQSIRKSIINPFADALLGKKGAGGKREGGAIGTVTAAFKTAFAPLRQAMLGPDGLWPTLKRGLADTWIDIKGAFFGKEKAREPLIDKLGRMLTKMMAPVTRSIEKAGRWLEERVIQPFAKWLNDPDTGIVTRVTSKITEMANKVGEKLFGENGVVTGIRRGIHNFFYGDPTKGEQGFVQRVLLPAKEFVQKEILEPLKATMLESWEAVKTFFKKEIFEPLRGIFKPFIVEFKEQMRLLGEWAKGPLWDAVKGIGTSLNSSTKDIFGTSLTEAMRKNVLDPIKEALDGVRKFVGGALASVLRIPITLLKNIGDELKISQIRRGIGGYISPEERARLLMKYRLSESDVPAGSGSSMAGGAGAAADQKKRQTMSEWWREQRAQAKAASDARKAARVAKKAGAPGADAGAPGADAGAPGADAGAGGYGTKDANAGAFSSKAAGGPGAAPGGAGAPQASQPPAAATGGGLLRASPEQSYAAAVATADNTRNIYTFIGKHLRNVGKNLERIVTHFKVKRGKVGENAEEGGRGLLSRLARMFTNPIGFFSDLVSSAFSGLRKGVDKIANMITSAIMIPINATMGVLKGLNKFIGGLRESTSNFFGMLKDMTLGAVDALLKGVGIVARAATDMLTTVAEGLARGISIAIKGIGDVAMALGKLGAGIIDMVGSIATASLKLAGQVIEIGAKVAKDIVTGLARLTFDMVGGVMRGTWNTMRGGGGHAALTPVFVVGGYLAGTEGGATTLGGAKVATDSGTGVNRLIRTAVGAAVGTVLPIGAMIGAAAGFFSPEISQALMTGKMSLLTAMRRMKGRTKATHDRLTAEMTVASEAGSPGGDPCAFLSPCLGAANDDDGGAARPDDVSVDPTKKGGRGRSRGGKDRGRGRGRRGRGRGAGVGGQPLTPEEQLRQDAAATANDLTDVDGGANKTPGISTEAPRADTFDGQREAERERETAEKQETWQGNMLVHGAQTNEHLGEMRKGFGLVGNMLLLGIPMLVMGIKTVAEWIVGGKIAGMAADLLGKGGGFFKRGAGTGKRSWGELGKSAMSKGFKVVKVAGTGLAGLLGGMLGSGMRDYASENMEEGSTGQKVAKSAGAAMEYGSYGAMIGGMLGGLPGAAVGAGLGAVAGIAVENWDAIKGGFVWLGEKLGVAATALGELGKGVWTFLAGADVQYDEATGRVTQRMESSIFGRMIEGLFGAKELTHGGQVVKEGGIGVVGHIYNGLLDASLAFGNYLNGVETPDDPNSIIGSLKSGMESAVSWTKGALESTASAFDYVFSTDAKSIWADLSTGLKSGFEYVTSGDFVMDLKNSVMGWWEWGKQTYSDAREVTVKSVEKGKDTLKGLWDKYTTASTYGDWFTAAGKSERITVQTAEADRQAREMRAKEEAEKEEKKASSGFRFKDQLVQTKAAGGPLSGTDMTVVGELGPEVIYPGGKGSVPFSDAGLVEAAASREGGILDVLESIRANTYYGAAYGEATTMAALTVNSSEKSKARNGVKGVRGLDDESPFEPGDMMSPSDVGMGSMNLQAMVDAAKAGTDSGAPQQSPLSGGGGGTSSGGGGVLAGFTNSASGGSAHRGGGGGQMSPTSSAGQNALQGAMDAAGITDPKERAMFLANMDHESGGFTKLEESFKYKPERLASVFGKHIRGTADAEQLLAAGPEAVANRVYGGRNGNNAEGDGYKYRGRGFIQLTGKANYADAGKALGMDLVGNPDLASQPEVASKIAVWFWQSKGVGEKARMGDVSGATKIINGGYNGLADRQAKYQQYLQQGTTTMVADGGAAGGGNVAMSGSTDLKGLRLKSEETTGGGPAHPGVVALAHALQGTLGGELTRFTALNDKYHKGRKSQHAVGRALDFTVKSGIGGAPAAAAKVKSILSAASIGPGEYQVIDEYNRPSSASTGGHIHVGFSTDAAAAKFQQYAAGSTGSAPGAAGVETGANIAATGATGPGMANIAATGATGPVVVEPLDKPPPTGKIQAAMFGGRLSSMFPTLVGERRPEILGPDGKIHPSIESFMGGSGADVQGLAVDTALKEAAKRMERGDDPGVSAKLVDKLSASLEGGASDATLREILDVLKAIATNTGMAMQAQQISPSAAQSAAAPAANSTNIFAMHVKPAGAQQVRPESMSDAMRNLVTGK